MALVSAIRGKFRHFTLNQEAHTIWNDSAVFPSVAALVGTNPAAEGHRRVLVGVQLLSQAILEHRPAFKILNLVIGLESMLLERRRQSQGFRLARRAADIFTCSRRGGSMCGRDRSSCQALALDPESEANRESLKRFRKLAEMDTWWRCSERRHYFSVGTIGDHLSRTGTMQQSIKGMSIMPSTGCCAGRLNPCCSG